MKPEYRLHAKLAGMMLLLVVLHRLAKKHGMVALQKRRVTLERSMSGRSATGTRSAFGSQASMFA